MKRYFAIGAAVLLALLIVGCGFGPGVDTSRPGLYITLSESWARSVVPSVPGGLDIHDYIITGVNNTNADTIGPLSVSGSTFIEGVSAGNWDITAVARNPNSIPLAEGTDNVDVMMGLTAYATIVCAEYTDPSDTSFSVNLGFEPDILVTPGSVSYLKPHVGDTVPVPLTVSTVSCTAIGSYGPPVDHVGWWTYILRLYELPNGTFDGQEVLAGGRAAAVRLVSGYNTQLAGWLHLYSENGLIDLDLSSVLHDELVLTPASGSPGFSDLTSLGTPPNDESSWVVASIGDIVTFDVECAAETVSRIIYENGVEVAVDEAYVLDTTGRVDGDYKIVDAVAFSTDGERGGSASWVIKTVATVPAQFDIAASLIGAVGGNNVWGFRLYEDDGVTMADEFWQNEGSMAAITYSHTFPALPAGDYVLLGGLKYTNPTTPPTFPLTSYEYWDAAATAETATVITIPHPVGQVYAMAQMNF